MSPRDVPSPELLAGRRALEGMEGVKLMRDWLWHDKQMSWSLHCQLTISVNKNKYIPKTTNWCVLVDDTYPWGSIKFFPDIRDSIIHTFPHQSYNTESEEKHWRSGDLCLSTSVRSLKRTDYDIEPYDIHKRLRWHFERALNWLLLASEDRLSDIGDPFELPQFPVRRKKAIVAFCEGTDTFEIWNANQTSVGIVEFSQFTDAIWFVNRFLSVDGIPILVPKWGSNLSGKPKAPSKGIWILLNTTPVLPPWQAPVTWGELRVACQQQNVTLDEKLNQVADKFRDGKSHFVLLGFPIAYKVGDAPQQVHWETLLLPALSYKNKAAKGFRPKSKGYQIRDRSHVLTDEASLQWIYSENWHKDQISTRGQLPTNFTSKRILLIGVGALGSAVAEFLIRAGVSQLALLDFDVLEVGNLVRHTLQVNDLGASKASATAERLNLASPHAVVDAISEKFPPREKFSLAKVKDCEIIIDCTGSDEVLRELSHFDWGKKKRLFVSLSVGLFAKRLYSFFASSETFPEAQFRNLVKPWLENELALLNGQELPREGIGCWHPVFPARVDDLWLFASIAVKHLVEASKFAVDTPTLTVFEQEQKDGIFIGVSKLDGNIVSE